MKDPQQYGVQPKSANLSDLMIAKSKANAGERVNRCPHGCEDFDLDDKGYCVHLVGTCTPEQRERGLYEPMVVGPDGLRRTAVPTVRQGDREVPQLAKLQRGDTFDRITTDYRVYRKNVVAPAADE